MPAYIPYMDLMGLAQNVLTFRVRVDDHCRQSDHIELSKKRDVYTQNRVYHQFTRN